MRMELPIHIPEKLDEKGVSDPVAQDQIIVSENSSCVSESDIRFIVRKVVKLLKTQGISCCSCSQPQYILSSLSACMEAIDSFTLNIICPGETQPTVSS